MMRQRDESYYKTKKGVLYTFIGAVLWGFSGTCGQYLFSHEDITPAMVTVIRMLFAGCLLLLLSFVKNPKQTKEVGSHKKDILHLILYSIFGLTFSQYSYLVTISYSNAGTATVLQYLGPVLIMIYACICGRRLPSIKELVAIVFAILGTFLLATHGNPSNMVLSKEGLTWGLLSAVGLLIYTVAPGNLISKWGSMIVLGYAMIFGGIFTAIITRVWTISISWNYRIILGLIAISLFGTAISYTLYLQGVHLIGSVKSSLIASVEPVAATIISALWLHTVFGVIDLVGFFFIMVTVFLLVKKKEE